MKSIRKTLTRRLSIVISILVISVLLAADIGVDNWVENEFNHAMKAKIGLLQTLVRQDIDGINFHFSGEYLPEFKGADSPEYFQLWHSNKAFKKSATLSLYKDNQLPLIAINLNEFVINDMTLPDGRSGRIVYSKFIPQMEEELVGESRPVAPPMIIAYATSVELLNFTLWFIDVAFILALILVPLVVRFVVKNTVSYSLTPLDNLNEKIREMRFSDPLSRTVFENDVEELTPITDSINHFIEDNYSLYVREKRLTSDIAHELKTPVTELINMTEVALKFPGEDRLEKDFKPTVLQIANRMKSIISGLMLLQKYSHQSLHLADNIKLDVLIDNITEQKNFNNIFTDIESTPSTIIKSNRMAIESIVNNLFDNATQHSKLETPINVALISNKQGKIKFTISNVMKVSLTEGDLSQMFDPLWQKDNARSSENNFGLGLCIVKTLCDAVNAEISVSIEEMKIFFSVTFPINPMSATER